MPLGYDNLHDDANPSVLQGKKVTTSQNIDAFAKTWPDALPPIFRWSGGNPPEYEREVVWMLEKKDFRVASKKAKAVTPKKKVIKKAPKAKPSVKKILKKIEKTAPKSTTFNHLYGQ